MNLEKHVQKFYQVWAFFFFHIFFPLIFSFFFFFSFVLSLKYSKSQMEPYHLAFGNEI